MFARKQLSKGLRGLRRTAAVAVITMTASTAVLASSDWTSVGSTGVPDEACAGIVVYAAQAASLMSSAPAFSSCTLRYQVVDTWEGDGHLSGFGLRARFLDNGLFSKVTASLRAYNFATGAITTVQTLSSESYPALSTFQLSATPPCLNLNFYRNSYWVEVVISRTAATGTPSIGAMRIESCVNII